MKEKYKKAKVEISEFETTEVLTDSYIELPSHEFG